jgi:methionine-rich copper-binding protein CopC
MKHKLFGLWVLLLTLIPLSANAHDQLVDQYPAEGEVIQAGVHELRLTFSDELLELEGGAGNEIVITNPNGENFYAGCLPVSGRDGLLAIDLEIAGSYQVAWRVVSSDGHPISDSFSFEVENSTGYVSDPAFAYPDCAGEVTISTPTEQSQFLYWLLWAAMGIVAVLLLLLLRPKKRPDVGEGS